MIYKNEEEKIKVWHRRADEGKKQALSREKKIMCFAIVVILIIISFAIFLVKIIGVALIDLVQLIVP